jgi:hypothetical protein
MGPSSKVNSFIILTIFSQCKLPLEYTVKIGRFRYLLFICVQQLSLKVRHNIGSGKGLYTTAHVAILARLLTVYAVHRFEQYCGAASFDSDISPGENFDSASAALLSRQSPICSDTES